MALKIRVPRGIFETYIIFVENEICEGESINFAKILRKLDVRVLPYSSVSTGASP